MNIKIIYGIKANIFCFFSYTLMVNYMKMSELQKKDIVNINTGEKIGNIIDLDVNNDGYINSLIVDRSNFRFIFSNSEEAKISSNQIIKIGEDVILVKD